MLALDHAHHFAFSRFLARHMTYPLFRTLGRDFSWKDW
jgi:hypothetical protein